MKNSVIQLNYKIIRDALNWYKWILKNCQQSEFQFFSLLAGWKTNSQPSYLTQNSLHKSYIIQLFPNFSQAGDT